MDAAGRTRLFREVNDCIDELLERFGAADAAEFLCECPSADCSRLLKLSRHEFERIRGEGNFIVSPSCLFMALSMRASVRFVVVPELKAVAGAPERQAGLEAAARLGAAARPGAAARQARAARSAASARRPAAVPGASSGWGAPAA
jgi:hypothetical protein